MRKLRWVFALIIVLVVGLSSIQTVFARGTADNSLELNVHNPGSNVAISIFSGYRPKSEYYRGKLVSTSPNTEVTIDAPINNKKIVDSWLYLYTGGYDTETFSTVKINGNIISGNEHLTPVGVDNNRQLLRINNVTQYITSSNVIKFTINGFGGYPAEVSLDGASLIIAYEDTALREYWIFDGTEYMSASKALGDLGGTESDISSTSAFTDPQYTISINAELYVVYHNFREPRDKLEFNGNELSDDSAESLVATDYLNILKFDVNDILSTSNSITFTSPKYSDTEIWPSIAILSVETQDTTPPTVSLATPADESLVSGDVEITGSIDDATSTISVLIGGEEKSTSLPYSWDTSLVSDGSYEIKVEATDHASNKGSKTVTVEVDNTPPSVSITTPINGSDVEGTVEITEATTDTNLDTSSLKIDGTEVSTTLPYSWDTSSITNGSHTVTLTATDKLGNTKTTQIEVNVLTTPTTTAPPTTTAAPTTTPPPTTLPPTTLPPSTVVPTTIPPMTTAPPLEEADLGIQILSITPQPAVEGEDVEIKLLVLNYGEKRTNGKVELHVGDDTFDKIKSERVKIEPGESKSIEYMVNIKNSWVYDGPGKYWIKALVNLDLDVTDIDKTNNEVLDHLVVEKKPSRISLAKLWPIVKWIAIIAIIIVVVKVIQTQMSPERDYLR